MADAQTEPKRAVDVPVVIAGAGPVGLTLALSLAQSGVKSLVLEKKASLDPHSRATLLVPRSLEHISNLGLLPAFLQQGQRNDAIRILRAKDRKPLLEFNFAPLADRTQTPFALALSQDRTERILLDAVRATGMVEVAFDEALERFEDNGLSVRVTSTQGRGVRAALLVGADGAKSTVRSQLGLSLKGKTYPTRAMLADVKIAPEADLEDGWIADPDATSFTIGIRFGPGVWRIIEAAVPDDLTDDMLAARAHSLTTALFGGDAWRETIWTAAYHKHERRADRYVEGRIVLAGDAAHLNSPAGGQGLNAGLADVELLAKAIVAGLAVGEQMPDRLGHYEDQRISAFDTDIRGFTDNLERMESAPAWLRNLAFSAIGLARAAGIEGVVARRLSMLDAA